MFSSAVRIATLYTVVANFELVFHLAMQGIWAVKIILHGRQTLGIKEIFSILLDLQREEWNICLLKPEVIFAAKLILPSPFYLGSNHILRMCCVKWKQKKNW